MSTVTQTQPVPLVGLTSEERAEMEQDIQRLFTHPEQWLNTRHHLLDNHKPCEFLEPGRERPLLILLTLSNTGYSHESDGYSHFTDCATNGNMVSGNAATILSNVGFAVGVY